MTLQHNRLAGVMLAAALAAAAGGCAMTFDARALGVTATMAAPAAQVVQGDSFAVTSRAVHLFWGLYPVKVPNARSVLSGQITGSESIANLRIRVRKKIPDLIITALTLGIVTPTAVTYEGVIVPGAAPGGQ